MSSFYHSVVHNPSSTNFIYDPATCPPVLSNVYVNTTLLDVPLSLAVWSHATPDPPTPVIAKGAKPPTVYPMGDNYGEFHVDYCATYTEHVGACLYEYPKERNLYDCGMPNKPSIDEEYWH